MTAPRVKKKYCIRGDAAYEKILYRTTCNVLENNECLGYLEVFIYVGERSKVLVRHARHPSYSAVRWAYGMNAQPANKTKQSSQKMLRMMNHQTGRQITQ
jgi:hypothetical protein